MSTLQFYLAMAVPTLAVLLSIYVNQRAIESLRDDMSRRMERLESRLDRIEADLREFYRTLGQHDARLDNLEKSGA